MWMFYVLGNTARVNDFYVLPVDMPAPGEEAQDEG